MPIHAGIVWERCRIVHFVAHHRLSSTAGPAECISSTAHVDAARRVAMPSKESELVTRSQLTAKRLCR